MNTKDREVKFFRSSKRRWSIEEEEEGRKRSALEEELNKGTI